MTRSREDLEKLVVLAKPAVFWSDRPDAPSALAPLREATSADLVIIGAGFTGLWAAIQAITENPSRDIVVVEAQESGFGASTRNGGFCDASLTHGLLNGIGHWPDEIETLIKMGDENLEELVAMCADLGIDASVEATGEMDVAIEEWQVEDLHEYHKTSAEYGHSTTLLDEREVKAQLNSPLFLAGLWRESGTAMINPAELVWGLRKACLAVGVRIFENTKINSVTPSGTSLRVESEAGSVIAPKVIVATNAWAQPEKQIRRYIVPIYDHVLMTEPLSAEQMDSIGWANRQGVGDSANQFHYFRLSKDNRILWGGYDANYYKGNGMGPAYEERIGSHATIAGHFYDTFPQLEDLSFSHRWAGPIGTTSKFSVAFGSRHDGALVWAGGYTGLGVGASRWGARVALDLVDGKSTERTALKMVRRKPMPFPPEPLRNPVIQFTRSQIARADKNEGRPGAWLRLLDAMGVGFDS